MKVIMTGGGTGGHIYPAHGHCRRDQGKGQPDAEILFVGTKKDWKKLWFRVTATL